MPYELPTPTENDGGKVVYFDSNDDAYKLGTLTEVENWTPEETNTGGTLVLLLHGNGENNSTTVVDETENDYTITCVGDAKISTGQYVFSTGSLSFSGAGRVEISNSPNFDFGSEDFTIKFRVRFSENDNSAHAFWDNYDSGLGGGGIGIAYNFFNNQLHIYADAFPLYSIEGWTPSINTWYAMELVRDNGYLKVRINGTQIGTSRSIGTVSIQSSSLPLLIGARKQTPVPYNCYHKGYIDEIAVWKGVCKDTSDYTPETTEFTAES